ncbi:hypothetical protein, partial [Streptomyces hydrogenans]
MTTPATEPTGSATPDFSLAGAPAPRQNRTRDMQLIPEALARAHMHERRREADAERQLGRPRPPQGPLQHHPLRGRALARTVQGGGEQR